MTVGELSRRMDHAEFAEWVELESIDPIPDPYWIGAMIASTVVHSLCSSKVTLADFMPARKPKRPQTTAEMRAVAMTALAGFGVFVPDDPQAEAEKPHE